MLELVGLVIWVIAPGLIWAALPILLLAACPLSVLVMMRGVPGSQSTAQAAQMSEGTGASPTRDECLAHSQGRLA